MRPLKISAFAVPSHVVFRPSGKPIRVCNEGKSLPMLQRECARAPSSSTIHGSTGAINKVRWQAGLRQVTTSHSSPGPT
jgi:hypothetical protein